MSHSFPLCRDFPPREHDGLGWGSCIGTSVIGAPSHSKPPNLLPSDRLHCILNGSFVYIVKSSFTCGTVQLIDR
jgi:hypothetical protein